MKRLETPEPTPGKVLEVKDSPSASMRRLACRLRELADSVEGSPANRRRAVNEAIFVVTRELARIRRLFG